MTRDRTRFSRHCINAETEAAVPPDPELGIEESDAWWVYQNQEPLVTSLETHDARFSKFQEILKKYGVQCSCTLPLTTAHSKVGTLTFGSKAPDIYNAEEVRFLSVVAEQIALAFDNALHFDASQASEQQLLKKNERLGLLLELTNHVVSNLEFRDLLRAVVASTRRVMGCDGVGIVFPTPTTHICGSTLWIFHSATNPSKRGPLSPSMKISQDRSFAPANSGAAACRRRGDWE